MNQFTSNTAPLGLEDSVRSKLEALSGLKPQVSYQQVGGKEIWQVTDDLAALRSPMMVTNTWSVPDSADISGRARLHLASGVWIDLDNEDLSASVKDLGKTADMLRGIGIDPEHCGLYATGSKGFHIHLPLALVIPGGVSRVGLPTIRHWPALCKAFVMNTLVTESTDFCVYSGGRGRQWRQVGVKRPNDAYKVPVTWADALKLDAASYALLCSAPRDAVAVKPVLDMAVPAAAAWQKAYQQVTAKRAKSVTTASQKMRLAASGKLMPLDRQRIERLLAGVPVTETGYADWIKAGCALKSTGASDALEIWTTWSMGFPGAKPAECSSRWDGLSSNRVSIGTLVYLGRDHV